MIRQIQNPAYFETLSESEIKSFNHFMILRGLSMDNSLVETIAFLYRGGFYDKIPSPQFYKLLISRVPASSQFFPWIKSSKIRYKEKLLEYVARKFEVSKYEANDYVALYVSTDQGLQELISILEGYGLVEKEIEELIDKN